MAFHEGAAEAARLRRIGPFDANIENHGFRPGRIAEQGMGRAFAFHLSFYLTLALAAVCLGFAAMFFLPWMPWMLVGMAVLLWLAWKYEGEWQLSEPAANTVGLVIAFGMLGWIVFQIPRSEEDLLAAGVPWPAGLLPHLAPLLMVLTAVKVFRPKKVYDFWVLQVLGVMMITLASVLAGEMDHGLWIFLYVISLTWCLHQYYRMQRDWRGEPEPLEAALFPVDAVAATGNMRQTLRGLGRATAWSMAAAGLGMGLFFFAPRHPGVQWIPHKLSVGAIGRLHMMRDAGMDLNRTGKVELSDEVAFEVAGQDVDGSTVDIPDTIYWRNEVLDNYHHGRWYSGTQSTDPWGADDTSAIYDGSKETVPLRILSVPPLFGGSHPSMRPKTLPAQFTYLTIRSLPNLAGTLVLAEPIDLAAGVGINPYIGERPSRSGVLGHLVVADTIIPLIQAKRAVHTYGQAIDLKRSPLVQAAANVNPKYIDNFLRQKPPTELEPWARRFLLRQSTLSADARTLGEDKRVSPEHHAAVAKAIARHFAESGEYLYSLNLRRVDAAIDPNVDFLLNVKEGHCERYASGLALTLRALGIPARIVHGFHGCEKTEDHRHIVRFNQAHSWVQALVPRAGSPALTGPTAVYDWLLLDPTPSQEAPLDRWQAFLEWAGLHIRQLRTWFRDVVLDYGSEQQLTTLRSWWASASTIGEDGLGDPWVWAGILTAIAAAWRYGRPPLVAWWRGYVDDRRQRGRLPWLTESLAIVEKRYGLAPTPSQTLLEFAASLNGSAADGLASPLTYLIECANQVIFGGRSLDAAADAEVAACVARIRTEISGGTP